MSSCLWFIWYVLPKKYKLPKPTPLNSKLFSIRVISKKIGFHVSPSPFIQYMNPTKYMWINARCIFWTIILSEAVSILRMWVILHFFVFDLEKYIVYLSFTIRFLNNKRNGGIKHYLYLLVSQKVYTKILF